MKKPMRSTEVESFPLYWEVKAALRNKDFLMKGGIIGFYCSHFYAQKHLESPEVLPQALKGLDMMVYAVGLALRLPVHIRPIMHSRDMYVSSDEEDVTDASDGKKEKEKEKGKGDGEIEQQAMEVSSESQKIRYTHNQGEDIAEVSHRTFDKSKSRVGREFLDFHCYDEEIGEDRRPLERVSTRFRLADCVPK